LLAKQVTQRYGGKVEFVSENWGESKLAERFGLKRYPVVFVDDVLVARSDDFGWFGNHGRYTPWKDAANHARFKKDLERVVDLQLRGDTEGTRDAGAPTRPEAEIARLPALELPDVAGHSVDTGAFRGKVVLVEFWATWCLPCRSTLEFLGRLQRTNPNRLAVVAVAIESPEADVKKLAKSLHLPFDPVLATPEVASAFGSISSVPTLYVFGSDGNTASVLYGAPEDLHEKIERLVASQLSK
jgi:thiol-disulfide isomerase/thioredoxin